MTERMMADRRFKSGVLAQVAAGLEREPRRLVAQATFIRAQAFVNLGVAEGTIGQGALEEVDHDMATAQERVRSSLMMNPRDSFLWLMLYSLVTAREGVGADVLRYFDQSYATGPYEGGIAMRRNRLSLSAFPLLDESQKDRAVAEFARIVDSDLTVEAGLILTGVGRQYSSQLTNGLESVDVGSRQDLSRWLSDNGYKMQIPGVELPDRPW
ncbi:hypothetical protein [Bradyrhizobium sp. 195]|uniref:hypothetical protein n=1 Tax=Bradyrhizobium sp. 195 TaxID=2782662 RepID=UPI0020014034|nr:hypothetical protein [Bradyrhizobium sp. 195]UPK25710.1 hypothetical protein IVB26_31055 [Bradyrhizobium sp. 195]